MLSNTTSRSLYVAGILERSILLTAPGVTVLPICVHPPVEIAATAAVTNAVLAAFVVLSPGVGVGTIGLAVKVAMPVTPSVPPKVALPVTPSVVLTVSEPVRAVLPVTPTAPVIVVAPVTPRVPAMVVAASEVAPVTPRVPATVALLAMAVLAAVIVTRAVPPAERPIVAVLKNIPVVASALCRKAGVAALPAPMPEMLLPPIAILPVMGLIPLAKNDACTPSIRLSISASTRADDILTPLVASLVKSYVRVMLPEPSMGTVSYSRQMEP